MNSVPLGQSVLAMPGGLMLDHATAVFVSDFSHAQPSSALSPRHQRYHWQTVPYEADGVSGVMLAAGPETQVPPVTVDLNATGWHAVFIGLYSNWTTSRLRVKLSDDPAFVAFAREEPDNFAIDERFWKYADLTGQRITFGQQSAGNAEAAYVAYVKLIPLTDAQAVAVQADRANRDYKRLISMNDGFSSFHRYRPTTAEEIWEWLEPYRDTDVKRLLWGIGQGGDMVTYPSRVGHLIGTDITDFPRVGDRQIAESVQILAGKGINTMQTVVDYGHAIGIEVYASQRMEAFQCSPPFDEFFTGRFYQEHPEWRCIDIDGRAIGRLSYAFPQVRQLVMDVFREVATDYHIDGINPIFNRGAPFLLYETPLVEGFQAATGLDPRTLAEDDERYLRYRAAIMTDFMRELRQTMDAIGQQRGRRLGISAHVLNTAANNLFYGLDVPTWVDEGLIDSLVAYPWRNENVDVAYFSALTRATPIEYYAEIMPRRMSPAEYRQLAVDYYSAGADGLCLWDTSIRYPHLKEWSMARRLGHRDAVADYADGEGEFYRRVVLRSVGGYVMDKYPPHWAF